jgi:hypothetical protein
MAGRLADRAVRNTETSPLALQVSCPLSGVKRASAGINGMSAFDGVFNRSTQHLLILLEEEVCDGGDCTDMVHAAAEG